MKIRTHGSNWSIRDDPSGVEGRASPSLVVPDVPGRGRYTMTTNSNRVVNTWPRRDTRSKNSWRAAETRLSLGETLFLPLFRLSCPSRIHAGSPLGIHDQCIPRSCHRLSGYLAALPRGTGYTGPSGYTRSEVHTGVSAIFGIHFARHASVFEVFRPSKRRIPHRGTRGDAAVSLPAGAWRPRIGAGRGPACPAH
jgi:hypothetical protein